jgi:hypothetical protein
MMLQSRVEAYIMPAALDGCNGSLPIVTAHKGLFLSHS